MHRLGYKSCYKVILSVVFTWRHQNAEFKTIDPIKLFFPHILYIRLVAGEIFVPADCFVLEIKRFEIWDGLAQRDLKCPLSPIPPPLFARAPHYPEGLEQATETNIVALFKYFQIC